MNKEKISEAFFNPFSIVAASIAIGATGMFLIHDALTEPENIRESNPCEILESTPERNACYDQLYADKHRKFLLESYGGLALIAVGAGSGFGVVFGEFAGSTWEYRRRSNDY